MKGTQCTINYKVPHENMVNFLFPGVEEFADKPDMLATGWLVGLMEWPCMRALRNKLQLSDKYCPVGVKVSVWHSEPVLPNTHLTMLAQCRYHNRKKTMWHITVSDEHHTVASGTVMMKVVHKETFIARHIRPKMISIFGYAYTNSVLSPEKENSLESQSA